MKYGYTTLAADWSEKSFLVKLISQILFFIPKANHDIEHLFPEISKWLIEIDEMGGIVHREIAFDSNGNVLFCAPNERNMGYWTDSSYRFRKDELDKVSQEYFEDMWKKGTFK